MAQTFPSSFVAINWPTVVLFLACPNTPKPKSPSLFLLRPWPKAQWRHGTLKKDATTEDEAHDGFQQLRFFGEEAAASPDPVARGGTDLELGYKVGFNLVDGSLVALEQIGKVVVYLLLLRFDFEKLV
ncbi:hypothetical protein Droror1_Dr00028244 [Drosera rotundifolia]